jgi:hypothetical protein
LSQNAAGHGKKLFDLVRFKAGPGQYGTAHRNQLDQTNSITAPTRHLPVTESVVLPPVEGSAMSDLQSSSDFTSIAGPACPNCRSEMRLSRVLPSRAALDLRTFECGKCAHVERVVVEVDPMKSSYAFGWLLGELRPPN